jgi:ketosteroid isomerase-like protein
MNRTVWRVTLLAGLLVSGSLACTKARAADSARIALEAAIQHWMTAVNAQDVVTLTTTMTEDVQLMDGTGTVTGRDAVIRALRHAVTSGQLIATSRETTIVDDVAWHVDGLAQIQKNGNVQGRGQALEIWKRMNGEWKLHRRMAAGPINPEDLLTRPSTSEPVLDRPER